MKAKYQYTGKAEQRHTIGGETVVLVNENTLELPVGNNKVQRLVSSGTLKLIEPAKTETQKTKSK